MVAHSKSADVANVPADPVTAAFLATPCEQTYSALWETPAARASFLADLVVVDDGRPDIHIDRIDGRLCAAAARLYDQADEHVDVDYRRRFWIDERPVDEWRIKARRPGQPERRIVVDGRHGTARTYLYDSEDPAMQPALDSAGVDHVLARHARTWRQLDEADQAAERAEATLDEAVQAGVDSDQLDGRLAVLSSALLRGDQLDDVPPPEPLIDDMLDLDTVTVIYSPPKKGKSALTIDLSCHIAAGLDWHGRQLADGEHTVLYIAAEGVRGFNLRRRAWLTEHPGADLDRLVVLPRAVNLFDRGWAEVAAALVAGLRPSLIVVDTLARSMAGANENATQDMGVVVEGCDRLRQVSGACVLLVHHAGKNTEAGMRGSTALLGAVDASYKVSKDGSNITVEQDAVKDHPEWDRPLRFKIESAPTGLAGRDGVELTSIVLRPVEGGAGADTLALLRSLSEIEMPGGITSTQLKAASGMPDRTYLEHRQALFAGAWIDNVGTVTRHRYVITEAGRELLGD